MTHTCKTLSICNIQNFKQPRQYLFPYLVISLTHSFKHIDYSTNKDSAYMHAQNTHTCMLAELLAAQQAVNVIHVSCLKVGYAISKRNGSGRPHFENTHFNSPAFFQRLLSEASPPECRNKQHCHLCSMNQHSSTQHCEPAHHAA